MQGEKFPFNAGRVGFRALQKYSFQKAMKKANGSSAGKEVTRSGYQGCVAWPSGTQSVY